MWKNYAIILMTVPVTLLMQVGLKMLLGWWTGDWKSAIGDSITFGLILLIAFEYYLRGVKRRATDAQRSTTDKPL